MKNKKRISIRFDEHVVMQLSELSALTGQSISCIIRAFVSKEINSCIDKKGYFKTNERTKDKEDKR